MAVFDPALPANNSEITSAQMRNQLNALNERIDTRVTPDQLTSAIQQFTAGPIGPFPILSMTVSEPPTQEQFQTLLDAFNDLTTALRRG